MADKQDELAEELAIKVLSKIDLPEDITKIGEFVLEIKIDTFNGKAIINYDLLAAAKWILDKNESEFIEYWNNTEEDDEDVYTSLHNSSVMEASISTLEILVQQLPLESEGFIKTLPQLAIKLDECISNEYQKQMSDDNQLSELKDSKEILDKFISTSSTSRRERLMKQINSIKEKSKPDLEQMAIYYEKLLVVWGSAKKLYEQVRNKDNWLEIIRVAYQTDNLPEDLIQRLSSQNSYESMPSRVALEHSARLCGVPSDKYRLRRLNQYLANSRKRHGLSAKRGRRPLH